MTGTCKPGKEQHKTSDPLALEQFLSAFLLLMMGILLAAALLFFEHLYFKYVRKHLAKKDRGGCCALVSLVSLECSDLLFKAIIVKQQSSAVSLLHDPTSVFRSRIAEHGQVTDIPWCRLRSPRYHPSPQMSRPNLRHPPVESKTRTRSFPHADTTTRKGDGSTWHQTVPKVRSSFLSSPHNTPSFFTVFLSVLF